MGDKETEKTEVKMADIYLICTVTDATEKSVAWADAYVAALEARGHKVHYPPREVDQNGSVTQICEAHREAMINADEVHIIWNYGSKGSHFDFGMAYVLKKRIVLANDPGRTLSPKTYTNLLYDLQGEQNDA